MLTTIAVVFAAVFLAELPDKTMFATLLLASRYRSRSAVWAGVSAAYVGHIIVAAALAKKFSGEQCVPAVAACAQALGAEGTLAARGHARRLLAARAMCIADGSTEMMNERLGASLLQRYAAHET